MNKVRLFKPNNKLKKLSCYNNKYIERKVFYFETIKQYKQTSTRLRYTETAECSVHGNNEAIINLIHISNHFNLQVH